MNLRVRDIRVSQGLSQQGFADELGVALTNIKSYEYGKRNPSDAFIQLLVSKYHVNEEWLRTGEGEMYAPKTRTDEIADIVASLMKDDDPFKLVMIATIAQLSDEQIANARVLMEELSKKDRPV